MNLIRKFGGKLLYAAIILSVSVSTAGLAEETTQPHYVSLRSDEVNVRVGPGTEYPIRWVFVRKGLPVAITAEFGNWRRIRDWEGAEGWVHRALLATRRTVLVTGGTRTLRRSPTPGAPAVLMAEPGVIAELLDCAGAWCRLEIAGGNGWMPRVEVWGVGAKEVFR